MANTPIQVSVRLNKKLFEDFSFYSTFTIPGRWQRMGLFSGIMAAFGCVCLFGFPGSGGYLLGGLLMLIGFGLPMVYIQSFRNSVKQQITQFHLEEERPAYTVEFSPAEDGIHVQSSSTAKERFRWKDCTGAYHHKGCTYLYVAAGKAFLLPDDQIKHGTKDSLWKLFAEQMPAEKLHDQKH